MESDCAPHDLKVTGSTANPDVVIGIGGAQVGDDPVDHSGQVDRLGYLDGGALSGQLEHVVDEAVEAVALRADAAHGAVDVGNALEHAARVQVAVALQRGERRAELVGHVGQEAAHVIARAGGLEGRELPLVDRRPQAGEHPVEVLAQLGQLTRPAGCVDRGVEVVTRDTGRGSGDPSDRPGEAPDQQPDHGRDEQQGDAAAEGERASEVARRRVHAVERKGGHRRRPSVRRTHPDAVVRDLGRAGPGGANQASDRRGRERVPRRPDAGDRSVRLDEELDGIPAVGDRRGVAGGRGGRPAGRAGVEAALDPDELGVHVGQPVPTLDPVGVDRERGEAERDGPEDRHQEDEPQRGSGHSRSSRRM